MTGTVDTNGLDDFSVVLDRAIPFRFQDTTESDGSLVTLIKIPGTFNGVNPTVSNGRVVLLGEGMFDVPLPGDLFSKIELVDHDNVTGGGADRVLGAFYDSDAGADNQGWYFWNDVPLQIYSPSGKPYFLASGLYLRLTLQKASAVVDTLRGNLRWCKVVAGAVPN